MLASIVVTAESAGSNVVMHQRQARATSKKRLEVIYIGLLLQLLSLLLLSHF